MSVPVQFYFLVYFIYTFCIGVRRQIWAWGLQMSNVSGTFITPLFGKYVPPQSPGSGVGICLSGGGSRAMSAGIGQLQALGMLQIDGGSLLSRADYLVTVSGYVHSYRGEGIPIPALVTKAAQFGNELVYYRRKFLRIPIFPQAAKLYASEWKRLLLNGELESTMRLSLLPGLAAAAAIEMKLTGSDKGIW